MTVLFLIITAICAYFLGGLNGAIIISKYIYRKDIRKYGSGNAGLTNFHRTFGSAAALLVILIDILKTIIGVLIGGALIGVVGHKVIGQLFAGFCLMLGHIYPAFYGFKGGKGVLSAGTMILLIDWRVGLFCWAIFIVIVVFTRYVSLGSMLSSMSACAFMWMFGYPALEGTLALLCGLLVVVKHSSNIVRLLSGTENKLKFGKKTK